MGRINYNYRKQATPKYSEKETEIRGVVISYMLLPENKKPFLKLHRGKDDITFFDKDITGVRDFLNKCENRKHLRCDKAIDSTGKTPKVFYEFECDYTSDNENKHFHKAQQEETDDEIASSWNNAIQLREKAELTKKEIIQQIITDFSLESHKSVNELMKELSHNIKNFRIKPELSSGNTTPEKLINDESLKVIDYVTLALHKSFNKHFRDLDIEMFNPIPEVKTPQPTPTNTELSITEEKVVDNSNDDKLRKQEYVNAELDSIEKDLKDLMREEQYG
jgi:hypothetical protein